jgi:hypothetical protein
MHVALDWPKFCFAVWNEPNDEVQRKLFGTVAIDGKELLSYCLWHETLSNQEIQEWDAFVLTLKPDESPLARLKNFRFSNQAANQSLIAPGVEVILGALKRSRS